MAFRTDEITTFRTVVICDSCKSERELSLGKTPLGFDNRMNGAIHFGYTFLNTGKQFMNYCEKCKPQFTDEQV
ncbi:hypothetical protein AB4Z45_08495 [Paenibacillus sp. MCAF9]|uniref:hypothetical protein n=1 Tax=Paenibacillus sp. MCAF9 TaxID=3233046 RepID=UPI003F97A63C